METTPEARFGQLLREWRDRRGVGLRELARLSGVEHHGTISHAERGRRAPSREVITALDSALGAGGELIAAWRELPVTAPRAPGPPLPRELAPVPDLVGRDAVIEHLVAEIDRSWSRRDRPVMVEVTGMGAVGKTAVVAAVVAALARDRPEAGVLWADLAGWAPHGALPVAAVLARWCATLGAADVGTEVDALTGAWRTVTAGIRWPLILVADNADSDQVPPLLLAHPHVLTIVTSRERDVLVSAGVDPAVTRHLDPLPDSDAAELLAQQSGLSTHAVAPLLPGCGGLPLALRAAGRHARHHTRTPEEIRAMADDLGPISDPIAATAAVSYRKLTPDAQRLWRRSAWLGLATTQQQAAAIIGLSPTDTRPIIEECERASLLDFEDGQYRYHDNHWTFAMQMSTQDDRPEERRDAAERGMAWWLHNSRAANEVLAPGRFILPEIGSPPPGIPVHSPTTYNDALAWCRRHWVERFRSLHLALDFGWTTWAWQLVSCAFNFAFNDKRHASWRDAAELVLADLPDDDRVGRGWMHHIIGTIKGEQGDLAGAIEDLGHALDLDATDARRGWTLQADVRFRVYLGDPAGDAEIIHAHLDEAIDLHTRAEAWAGVACANALRGIACRAQGDLDAAEAAMTRALTVAPHHEDPPLWAWMRAELSEIHLAQGDLDAAITQGQRALTIATSATDSWGALCAWLALGRAHRHQGATDDARTAYEHAELLAERTGDPRLDQIRDELADLDDGGGM